MQNSTRRKLLQLMADQRIHSGESLGQSLQISRSAVWKQIQALKAQGLDIEIMHGKGYRLRTLCELLDAETILAQIPADLAERLTLEVFDELESTNSYLMSWLKQSAGLPQVCLAEQQTAGRGRRGRSWQSPYGTSLAFSMSWRFNAPAADLAGLSLVAGLAVVRVLAQNGVDGVQLKWPNDLIWQNKKAGGILIEVSGDAAGPCDIVIGIGLNISNNASYPEMQAVDQPWVGLDDALNSERGLSRNRLSALLVTELFAVLNQFEQSGFAVFREEYLACDALLQKQIVVQQGAQSLTGLAAGVDEQGCLLLQNENGISTVNFGEVSVRAITAA